MNDHEVMNAVHRLYYADLGKPESVGLTGQVEVVLTRKQAHLLQRLNRAVEDSRPGWRSTVRFLWCHLRVVMTYPRLLDLGQYYDPENLDLAGFDAVDADHVRLTFHDRDASRMRYPLR